MLYTLIASVLIFLVLTFSPEVLIIFTSPKFYEASWAAGILGMNVLLIGYTYIASIGTSVVKNNKYYSYAMFIAMVLTIILDILLIPKWGINGSAIATVLAQFVVPIILFYYSQKFYPIPYPFKRAIVLLLIFSGLAVIIRFITFENYHIVLLVKILCSLVLSIVIVLKAKNEYLIIKNYQQLV